MKNAQCHESGEKRRRAILFIKTSVEKGLMGSALLLLACLCLSVTSCAAEKSTGTSTSVIAANQFEPSPSTGNQTGARIQAIPTSQLAPLAASETAVSLHSPFADGNCSLCHQNPDPESPGPLFKDTNAICLDCHEDFTEVMARPFSHAPVIGSCVNCHNPHNSKYPKLLMQDIADMCLSCHSYLKSVTTEAQVKHDATIKESACINCHNPHGTNVEHLLISLPYDLCITCHNVDTVFDNQGRQLTNFEKLLAENPEHHGPVADKDCSACHNPHGARYFRLLNQEYPAEFYSPYDPGNYALCFECHEEAAFEEPRTETLTLFRNGDKNLHFLHVNKEVRGRTCRACHEVHAAKQKHHIRAGVPYGSTGWVLKINYSPTPFGGSCGKNCHDSKSYNNQAVNPATAPGAPK